MRIIVLIEKYPPVFAGPSLTLTTLYVEMVRRGHNVVFITPLYSTAHPRYENYHGINIIRISPGIQNNWTELRFVFNSLRYIWKNKIIPDTLIDTKPFGLSMILTQTFANLFGFKIIARLSQVGTCDPIAAAKGRVGIIKNIFIRRYDSYINISPALSKLCEKSGIRKNRINTITNCINTNKFSPFISKNLLIKERKKLLPNAKGPIIMVPGSVTPRKRSHLALNAWRIIKEKYKLEGTLIFVGPTKSHDHYYNEKYFSSIEKNIQQYQLQDSVIFTGLQKEIHRFYKISDIVLFVSKREGLGTVILESLASECPVVCTKIHNITNFIFKNGLEGFITNDEPKNIAYKLFLLMTNCDLRKAMGLAGREKALKNYSAQKIADKTNKLIYS